MSEELDRLRRQLQDRAAEVMKLLTDVSDVESRAVKLRRVLTKEYIRIDEALDKDGK